VIILGDPEAAGKKYSGREKFARIFSHPLDFTFTFITPQTAPESPRMVSES